MFDIPTIAIIIVVLMTALAHFVAVAVLHGKAFPVHAAWSELGAAICQVYLPASHHPLV